MPESELDRASALAEKLTAKAEAALYVLNREMFVMKWPPEFQQIMWETVSKVAAGYADIAAESITSADLGAGP